MEDLFSKINNYTSLSPEAKLAWMRIINGRKYPKGSFFVKAGDVAKNVAFVSKGLFSQYAPSTEDAIFIKRFFSEGYFAASTTSLLSRSSSVTSIEALEDSTVLRI